MKFSLAAIVSMKILSPLLLLFWGAEAGEGPVPFGVDLIVKDVQYEPPPILSVRKLAISDFRIVRKHKQIWRELNESSTGIDVQKILNT